MGEPCFPLSVLSAYWKADSITQRQYQRLAGSWSNGVCTRRPIQGSVERRPFTW